MATDIHLGYAHKHELRGRDSLNTFEEILRIGKDQQVDFILLGGDLFHENRPPRHIVNGCIQLLRDYTMGDKPVEFDIVSDLSVNFEAHGNFPWPNFHDPNQNVAIPVFTIHGNHDDPTGCGAANAGVTLSVLNTLADAGLINYFGRQHDLQEVKIHPILFEKGTSKLAVFGLGAIREERLHRLWRENKVRLMQQPGEARNDWFNIFVVHQNHVKHTETTYVPEDSIDKSMDLVFWGHEHDCQIDPIWNSKQEFFVTQPGSSIATSLCEGETTPKHVGILHVKGKEFKIKKIPLKTVRPFYFKDVKLSDFIDIEKITTDKLRKEKAEAFCKQQVEEILQIAKKEWNAVQPKEPLIRLRVNRAFEGREGAFETFNLFRFGEQFKGRVANTKDIIQFKNVKARQLKQTTTMKVELDEGMTDQVGCMKDVVVKCLMNDNIDTKQRLMVQSETPLTEAMSQYVEKSVTDAIKDYVEKQIENMTSKLEKRLNLLTISKEAIEIDILELAERRRAGEAEVMKEEQAVLEAALKNSHSTKMSQLASRSKSLDMDPDNEEDNVKPEIPQRGRGRGRAPTRGARGKPRGKSAVVDVQTPSIDSFMSKSTKKFEKSYDHDISDDDMPAVLFEKNVSKVPNSAQQNQARKARTPKKKYFDSGSDEEFDPTPTSAKRGRR